jgi:hypothetical protein
LDRLVLDMKQKLQTHPWARLTWKVFPMDNHDMPRRKFPSLGKIANPQNAILK